MLTYTQLSNRALDATGAQDATTLANIQQDINQGLRLFKNAARRYWTRTGISTNIVATQQYYQLPFNCVRVSEVKVVANGLTYPVEQVTSEAEWNKMNVIPAVTINVPTYYFIRGYNEIGLWPVPSTNVTNGLSLAVEPRLVDMSLTDVTGTAIFTNNAVAITDSVTNFTQQMVGDWISATDGTDGNWYKLATFNSTSSFNLENVYQGITGSHTYLIGQVPDIPEDYHLALVHFALANFFAFKRHDVDRATFHENIFNNLAEQFQNVYASKTTGQVINPINRYRYNLFTIPPNPFSG